MNRPFPSPHQQAFTLIELAVVLAVIGIIAGGIVGGKSLIRAAEMAEITSSFNKYKTASARFVQQYKFLPGDFADATEYWGEAAAGTACATTVGTGTATCNGNADGTIYYNTNSHESFRFWQHLANAGLIDGKYNGVASNGTYNGNGATPDNSPSARRDGGQWFTWYWGTLASGSTIDGVYNNSFTVGQMNPGGWPNSPLLRSNEAYSIDAKIDDGKPGTGIVRGYSWSNCTTATSSSTISADYKSGSARRICSLFFPEAIKL